MFVMFSSPLKLFSLPFLALLLLPISNALSMPKIFDTNTNASATASASSNVVGPVTQLHVVNKNIAPDGYNRSTTLANGVFPAPLIQANRGDQFAIQVFNELTDPTMPLDTTIHWHGIFQKKSNWADGASSVTQCPLLPNEQFEYKFHVTGQSGTYWYHSHYTTQYCDGLRGPLVIYDPEDPLADLYDVDDENTVITLSDWYHTPSIQLGEIFGAVHADSTLINGHGRYAGGPATQLAVVDVEQGLRYRFRIVATACDPMFNFTIDGHQMTIIEVDGNEVVPVEVDWLPVFPGQRYSVVVTTDQDIGNYWIRALPSTPNSSFEGGQNMAILRYDGAPEQDPTSTPGPYELAFDEGDLHPLINPGAPGIPEVGKADVNIPLVPGFNSEALFTFNGVSFVPPTVPVLLQILSGARHASQLMPNGSVYVLPPNKVIELSFPNPANAPGGPHPIHLHGHSFDVIRVSGSNVTNFVNPVRRDVVSIGANAADNVTIRFVTNNPGPWFLHCHIDWHLHHGFAVVMAEAPSLAAEQESKVIPEEWYTLCPSAQPLPGQVPLVLPGN